MLVSLGEIQLDNKSERVAMKRCCIVFTDSPNSTLISVNFQDGGLILPDSRRRDVNLLLAVCKTWVSSGPS